MHNLADIFRNHYEKIALTLALVGLALAVIFVYRASESEKEDIAIWFKDLESRKPKPVTPANLSTAQTVIAYQSTLHYSNTPALNLSTPHNFLNPVKWKRTPDGRLTKITSEQDIWDKMVITRIEPLEFTVTLDRIPTPGGYWLGATREAADHPYHRRKRPIYATLNATNKLSDGTPIVLRQIIGPPEKPEQLVVEFPDAGEKVTLSSEQPFQRIEGYEADLKHEISNQEFKNLRVNSPLRVFNDDYIIVAITQNEVVASARANQKNYTVSRRASVVSGQSAANNRQQTLSN